ncbi:MAG: hypothetical protein MUC78_02055 [Bacteroidales bacterium]|jgi:hypothetical protein|nr:hypothetical protein [Bacteroidales bacterium]
MELFGKLRLRAGRMILRRQTATVRRLKQGFDMDRVKRVGILWDASVENDFQYLANLNRQMVDLGKSVEVLAWIPGKSVPDRLTGLTYMKFLKREDLNWAYIPHSKDARGFIDTRFDLLIDINPSSLFCLEYIVSLSVAPMKVGPDHSSDPVNAPYDLMIQAGKPFSIGTFLQQALHYLSLISNPETRA